MLVIAVLTGSVELGEDVGATVLSLPTLGCPFFSELCPSECTPDAFTRTGTVVVSGAVAIVAGQGSTSTLCCACLAANASPYSCTDPRHSSRCCLLIASPTNATSRAMCILMPLI